MGFSLTEYIKIKDNYCLCYFGHNTAHLVQLRILRPYIEQALPELRLHIACNDNYVYLFEDEPRIVPRSKAAMRKKEFAFIREVTSDHTYHIIEQLMKESDIAIPSLAQADKAGICLVCPEATPPVPSAPVETLVQYARSLGYEPVVVGSDVNIVYPEIKDRPTGEQKLQLAKDAKCIIGVENDLLYLVGFYGGITHLYPTGIGTNFYKKLFPNGKKISV